MIVIAVVYFGAAKFGLSLAFVDKQVTAVWPPTGIALVVLLLLGNRMWPGIMLGGNGVGESAGINRLETENERVLQRKPSQ